MLHISMVSNICCGLGNSLPFTRVIHTRQVLDRAPAALIDELQEDLKYALPVHRKRH